MRIDICSQSRWSFQSKDQNDFCRLSVTMFAEYWRLKEIRKKDSGLTCRFVLLLEFQVFALLKLADLKFETFLPPKASIKG